MTSISSHTSKEHLSQLKGAKIEFRCIEKDCDTTIKCSLLELRDKRGNIRCSSCHRIYQLEETFLTKLEKLRVLILAVRDAQSILGDCNIAVVTPAGEVKIPYRLLLTRLNTLISLDCNGKKLEFLFRVEPLSEGIFK